MSLQDVMQRYCQGDQGAFDELYRALAPKIRARVRLLVRDGAMAEDLLQLTFLKLHRARRSYRAGADPVPWVQAIARRNCIDELRRRRTRERLADNPEQLPEPQVDITGAPCDAEPGGAGVSDAAMLSALGELPANLREAVVLTKLRGHSVRQAARLLGTTETAVKLRAHRGYARLRVLLADGGEGQSKGGRGGAPRERVRPPGAL